MFAENVTTPTLIMVGEYDLRIPVPPRSTGAPTDRVLRVRFCEYVMRALLVEDGLGIRGAGP